MAPTGVMSSTGTVHSLSATPSCSSKIWHPKRLAGPSGLRRSPSHGSMDKACLRSSVSLKAVEYVYGRPRRSRIEQGGKRPSSRHLLVAAVEGSFAVEEASSLPADMTPEVSEEENAIDVPATPVPEGGSTLVEAVRASPRAERFKPRVPGQKARREDPEVPNEALVPGATFTGTVTTIQPFGAFVNFGAFTDGLVHISKLSKGYVSKISDFVKLGQQVKVTILNVEETSGRIALTMVEKENGEAREAATKTGEPREGGERSPSRFQQGPDGRPINRGRIAGGGRQSNKRDEAKKPPTKLVKGQEVEGTVKNKIRSGVFVDLPENEEAFLRFSDIPGGDNMYQESTLQIGEKIKATVLKIDRGKISLTQKPVVDILSVNRSINKGDDIGAANPFEIAFRAFNMIPKVQDDVDQEDKTVAEVDESEEISAQQTASETSSKDEEDEEVIAPKATALIPDEAATEYDASVDAATEGDPPAKLATSDESPVEAATEVESSDIASVEDVVSEATDAALKLEEVNTPAASSTDEIIAPEIAGPAEAAEAVEEAIPDANAAANEISSAVDEILSEAKVDEESPSTSEDTIPEIAGPAEAAQAVKEILPETSAAVDEISSAVEEILPEKIADEENRDAGNGIVEESSLEADAAKQQPPAQIPNVDAVNPPPSILEEVSGTEANPEVNAMLSEGGPALEEGNPSSLPVVEGALSTESIAKEASANGTLVELSSSPVSSIDEGLESAAASNPEASVTGVVEKEAAPQVENSVEVAKPKAGPSAATVKQLREETGAGMMDCKRALLDTAGDIEKARDYLRKKGLASADKKASRIAAEGLVGSYVHDSRVGVLVEVNCETDFVARGPAFKSLVQDVGMQVVASGQVQFVSVDDVSSEFVNKEKELEFQRDDLASKPEAIRAKIVEGRVSKRISELALLEQPYIRDDKIAVKDLVKQTVATLGENIKIRRFERYVLGEGLAKKGTDFAAEVAAQTAAASTKKADPSPASESSSPSKPAEPANTVAVSASLVKELRDQTGAGMMDCKKALAATENDLEKATDYLRKKGLAGAEKKAGRVAAEGLIGTYVHDGRIGVMIEVNCETDFVARGQTFKDLVQDMAMQVAAYPQVQFVNLSDIPAELVSKEKEIESGKEDLASKPEAIRAKIVDGRVTKRLSELALVEQAYIRDDKKAVKDVVKEAIASLGENIQVRRFVRFNLGEGLAKKVVDFASEVAAQSGVPAT